VAILAKSFERIVINSMFVVQSLAEETNAEEVPWKNRSIAEETLLNVLSIA
jgi:hypothetical protein